MLLAIDIKGLYFENAKPTFVDLAVSTTTKFAIGGELETDTLQDCPW